MRPFLIAIPLLLASSASAKVITRNVAYTQGKTALEGVLAYDDARKGKRPGVLVVHEWTGINDYVRSRIEQLAGLGYVAFAADIYGKGVRPKNREESDARRIKGAVLVLHGADDPFVPAKEVQAFQEEMRKAKIDWQMISYGGAVHSFTNPGAGRDPSKGAAYDARADRRSFEAMRALFAATLEAR